MATSCVRNSVWACCKPACNWVCSLSNAPLRRLISVTFSCKATVAPCNSAIWFLRPRMEAAALPEPWPFKYPPVKMPCRLSRSPSDVTKSKAPPESRQAAVAETRSGQIKVCPSKRSQQRLHRWVRLDDAGGAHRPAPHHVRRFALRQGLRLRRKSGQMQRGHAGAAGFVAAQIVQNLPGGLRLFSQDELQMVAQGRFNRHHVLVRHADFVGQRPEHIGRCLEGGKGAGTEAFVFGLQLFQHVQTRACFGLLPQEFV